MWIVDFSKISKNIEGNSSAYLNFSAFHNLSSMLNELNDIIAKGKFTKVS